MSTPATYPRSASDGLTQAPVLSVPVHLRALASWLESHPEARVDVIAFIDSPVVVSCYVVDEGISEFAARATAIGGEWRECDSERSVSLEQEIAPGVRYRLTAARSSLVEAA